MDLTRFIKIILSFNFRLALPNIVIDVLNLFLNSPNSERRKQVSQETQEEQLDLYNLSTVKQFNLRSTKSNTFPGSRKEKSLFFVTFDIQSLSSFKIYQGHFVKK